MLNSLLSFYIASVLGLNFTPTANPTAVEDTSGKLASANLVETLDLQRPIKDPTHIAPVIEAKGSIAKDLATNEILFEKNSSQRLKIASITKLMTITIILEENKLNDVVTISNNASGTEGSTMFLKAGEKITVQNLLYGALIASANDAAVALAEYNAGSVSKFVEKMNAKAADLGLTNSHFSNPVGLDDDDNYSSAADIANLGTYLYHNKFIKQTAKTKEMEVKSVSGNFTHKLESTNKLLDSYLKINGLKTGKTAAAGLCFVAIAENDAGHEIITVVLGSPDRFEESKFLIDWIFRSFNWPTT